MNLQCDSSLGCNYKSPTQIARVVSEAWCLEYLYCSACPSDSVTETPRNTKATDFICPRCKAPYQLKSSSQPLRSRINDSGYQAMIESIESGTNAHLLALRYTPSWQVNTLLLIPSFFFTKSAILKRKPLAPTAQRAGWVGCNILLSHIPPSGRIALIADGNVQPQAEVRKAFRALKDLTEIKPEARGWTLDVLRVVETLGKREFHLSEVYQYERELQKLHPANRNVRPKIRQQLQVLRDMGRLHFSQPGHYELA